MYVRKAAHYLLYYYILFKLIKEKIGVKIRKNLKLNFCNINVNAVILLCIYID